jgi:hypothetical protein
MKRFLPMRVATSICSAWLLLGSPAAAVAQSEPKFEYGKMEEAPKAVWKASAQAGLLLATGNSNSLTVSAGGSVSRTDKWNKIAIDLEGRFGRTTTFSAKTGLPMMGGMPVISSYDDITTTTAVSTQYWGAKLRYDRFFSKNNLGYLVAQAMGDDPAGKHVFGGGQVGYSRQLYKSERNEFLAEIGYDFTFVDFTSPPERSPIFIHSLRAYLSYNLTLSKDTSVNTGVEGLFNLNNYESPGFTDTITPFQDTRVNFKTALSTKLHKNVSFRFAFKLRFDNVPAPRPPIAGATYGTDPTTMQPFTPISERVDTLSEAALIVNFL